MARVGGPRCTWAVRSWLVGSVLCGVRLAHARPSVHAFDASGVEVDAARSHASLARTAPLRWSALAPSFEADALRFVVSGTQAELTAGLQLITVDARGQRIDRLEMLSSAIACPPGMGPLCIASAPVRIVADDVDRQHPLVRDRSVLGVLGGAILAQVGNDVMQRYRIGGPRMTSVGPMPRLLARLRVYVVRQSLNGLPPFGIDDAHARSVALRQVEMANAIWGQCGITFGGTADVEVRIVNPPEPHMIAVGCDAGLPASGGELRLRADGHDLRVSISSGTTPRAAARLLVTAFERVGLRAWLSENARIEPGADRSTDVLVRRRDGQFAKLEAAPRVPLSTDRTMQVCLGGVDLADGLDHFVDVDAPAGTLEERALIKAFDDGDPSRIDVFMITAFAGGGRVGESFIYADRSSVRNVVIEDRAGIRADRASFALAHELGHILLDMPGHPDDFGVDMPTLLMDSDAADPTAFGPRRLTLPECARALRQSGPAAPVPLLETWPLDQQGPPARAGGPGKPGGSERANRAK